jgi:RHS repeat-associated protein
MGTVVWPLGDQVGSIRDLVTYDAETHEMTLANHRNYDSFGNLVSETPDAAVDELFGFTGRMFDAATGLQNNLNRWYDPAVGMWISEDPIGFAGGEVNLSGYVGNDPVNFTDPTGLIKAKDGHHLVNQANWGGMSEKVMEVFNSCDARIRNDFYKFHDGSKVNGITHDAYNMAVADELSDFWASERHLL